MVATVINLDERGTDVPEYVATLECGHCRHRFTAAFKYPESLFQCVKCGAMSARIVTGIRRIKG